MEHPPHVNPGRVSLCKPYCGIAKSKTAFRVGVHPPGRRPGQAVRARHETRLPQPSECQLRGSSFFLVFPREPGRRKPSAALSFSGFPWRGRSRAVLWQFSCRRTKPVKPLRHRPRCYAVEIKLRSSCAPLKLFREEWIVLCDQRNVKTALTSILVPLTTSASKVGGRNTTAPESERQKSTSHTSQCTVLEPQWAVTLD